MIYAVVLLAVTLSFLIVYFRFPGIIIAFKKRYVRRAVGLSRHAVQIDDFRWAYLAGGKGEVVLLVHGFGGDKDRWLPFLTPFDRNRYQVIVPDLPGFGENSRLTNISYDVPHQAERLHRFVQTLKVTSFHLVGVSMGGCIAGYYAGQYPDQVKSLALIDASGVGSAEPSDMAQFQKESKKNILIVKSLEQFLELNRFMYHNPPHVSATFVEYFARQAMAESAFHLKVYNDLQKGGDAFLEDWLPDINAPTVVIWGAEDRVFHVSSVNVFQKKMQNCRVAIIERCGHLPYLEKPEETREVYWRFIEGA